ncbi:DUF3087 domain-containing protein [Psychromonas sp. Urea-02u-13]|uniref:DUF3087 domain-containing protein n=1 Tax=Psychromonas sp. Urea-02u-13 TaxID=2058326 RepID=UPI000C33D277|nr:DUF3087 domain-containing protein [Psychromonas sp. Urea-02u-13]PKG38696.1 DUF3087 domain-containing protein [Psychromonas sp. Urea-02u-13]
MLIIEIDKTRYRRHFNIVIVICISVLALGSLGIAQLLIALFPAQEGTHFHWNLLGVVVSVAIIAIMFKVKKDDPFLYEVLYVWRLKQALNLIGRKIRKLKQAAKMGDTNAMLALQFSYTGSRQLWTLDDNTITLNSLDKSQRELDELLVKYDVSLDITQYKRTLLNAF